jgi:hypothetical protein
MVTKLKKKKPTRKRKVLPVEQLEEMAREEAEKFKVLADRRGRMAKAAYAAQDKATREVLDAIRDRLSDGCQRVAQNSAAQCSTGRCLRG